MATPTNFFEDRGWIDFEFKGGILANTIDVTSSHIAAPGAPQGFAGNDNRTAFVIDLSLVLNYQFTRSWTAKLGYNFFWIDGVALARAGFKSPASPWARDC